MADQAAPTPAPVPVVQVMPVVPDHSSRITTLERHAEDTDRLLADHDKVLSALVNHLGQLVARLDRFEKRLLIAAIVVFSGTQNGDHLLNTISNFLQ